MHLRHALHLRTASRQGEGRGMKHLWAEMEMHLRHALHLSTASHQDMNCGTKKSPCHLCTGAQSSES
jgi:hypothetical protein